MTTWEIAVDTIILSTGFHVTEMPHAQSFRGRDGQTLAEVWADGPRVHAGTAVAGFPNLFLLLGPNTGLGHSSVLLMLEAQIEHVLGALGARPKVRNRGARTEARRASRMERRHRSTQQDDCVEHGALR